MSRAKDVRERWITEVLRTDAINDGCKLVLIAMSRHMTEKGRVSYPRERIAAEVGLKTPQRVTNRIKEARDAGLIDLVHPGHKGMTATYEAMLPCPKGARDEHPLTRKGNGQRAPFDEHPLGATDDLQRVTKGARSEHPNAGAHARATYRTRIPEPAPDGSRGPGPSHSPNSGSNGEPATPALVVAADSPWAPTTQLQADDVRARYESIGRSIRERVLGQEAAS